MDVFSDCFVGLKLYNLEKMFLQEAVLFEQNHFING